MDTDDDFSDIDDISFDDDDEEDEEEEEEEVEETKEAEKDESDEGGSAETLRVKIEEEESSQQKEGKEEIKFKWWIKPSITYAFRHPVVTARLERLMGSNSVSLSDRDYMQKLQLRVVIDYANSAQKRITAREKDEMERVKYLVLSGKVSFADAPPEMYDHPIMVIERHCQKLIAERRAKIKVPKVNIPNHLYWDDTIDPPSGLTIEKGHMFRDSSYRICIPCDKFIEVEDEVDIENGYMLTEDVFATLRYEDPKVKELKNCETVEDMYNLSDDVMGIVKEVVEVVEASEVTEVTEVPEAAEAAEAPKPNEENTAPKA